uniref:EF-hand domain-containing protein n=1 Tax=Parastrongyloides trichosuri TaxID=131310 RepID=A0A0N4ZVH1_PARTI
MSKREDEVKNNNKVESNPNESFKIPKFKYNITPDEDAFYDETLLNMRKDNIDRINKVTPFDYHFFRKRYVNYIFTIATRLSLSPMIRYQALYLFDRFSSRHIGDCFGALCEAEDGKVNSVDSDEWQKIESHISRQLTLRVLTCFQICIKTFDCKDYLPPGYTARCLKALGHSYTKDAILKSEIRVVSTVQFKLWDRENPLVYVETLLAVICKSCKFLEDKMDLFYQKCVFMMDYAILNIQDIFNLILMNNYNRTVDNIGQLRFNRLLSDWLLMASGIIHCTSLTMGYSDTQIDQILLQLSKNTLLPKDDIKSFSIAVLLHLAVDLASHYTNLVAMTSADKLKEVFNLYDEELDGKVDVSQIGDVIRACGLKPTNAQVLKAYGGESMKKGSKRVTFEEWLPIYEQVKKEKEVGSFADFLEGLRVFDKDEAGKIYKTELRHVLLALGERLTADEADELLKDAADAEGLVNYEAFIKKVIAGPYPDDL